MESILCEVDFSWEGWREEESWREDDVRDRRRTNKKKVPIVYLLLYLL